MSSAQLLSQRQEVLPDDRIEGITDPRNVHDRELNAIESRSGMFVSLTYAASKAARIIQRLRGRSTRRVETPALFFAAGITGSRQPHLLVLMNHLLNCPTEARWFRHDCPPVRSPWRKRDVQTRWH